MDSQNKDNNVHDDHDRSPNAIDSGLPKQSLLLRLFESKLFNIELTLTYLKNSKDPGVLSYLGNRMFTFPPEEVDFYLPQLIILYLYNSNISEAIHNYLVSRSNESIFTSLHIVWLVNAFDQELCSASKQTRSVGYKLRHSILEDSEQPQAHRNVNNHSNRYSNGHSSRNHCRSLSDATCIVNHSNNTNNCNHHHPEYLQVAPPTIPNGSNRVQLGNLSSGHAFDANSPAHCDQSQCNCLKSAIKPQYEFIRSLMKIGTRMQSAVSKQLKSQLLISELSKLNLNLPARVWLPIYSPEHMIVRIPPQASVLLNSKDKSPFLIYMEVVECDNVLHSRVPSKHNLASLNGFGLSLSMRLTKSEDNLMEYLNTMTNKNGAANGEDRNQTPNKMEPEEETLVSQFYLYRYRPQAFDSISQISQDSITSMENIFTSAGDVRKRLDDSINKSSDQHLQNVILEDPSVAAFKEPWDAKVARIRESSPYGHLERWQLVAAIVKCGDDLRQELLAYQVLMTLQRIWMEEKVPLWLKPYRIHVTSSDGGIIEPILNSMSLHQIKKHSKLSLIDYYVREFGGSKTCEQFLTAQYNFVRSCAAYCVFSYILQLKDRHNGNILIDDQGHMIHIDFGFILSNSPKNLGFENSPFKLTQEFIDVMGGHESDMFQYFKCLLLKAFSTLRKHCESILNLIEILISSPSMVASFANTASILRALKLRFHMNLTETQLQQHIDTMVESSVHSITTRLYDGFQYFTNGIQ